MILLKSLLAEAIGYIFLGIVIYVLTKLLKFDHQVFYYDNPRKRAMTAIISVSISFIIITILLLIFSRGGTPNNETNNHIKYGFNSVLSNGFIYLIIISPVLIAMKKCKETWSSAGITKIKLFESLFIGAFIGILSIVMTLICTNISIIKVFPQLNMSHFWALIYFFIVGFCEELMFRGYLQTRFIAWLGKYKGWIFASIFMALVHLPQRMLIGGMNLTSALASAVSLISISMLMGFMMIRTRNVIASAVYHTLADWGGTLI